MQKLFIKGFLGIKNAEIIVNGLTVLIGQQAAGKSLVARLFYFFDEYLYDFENLALIKREHKKTYDKKKKNTFSQLFPSYSWENEEFEIKFFRDEYYVKISSRKDSHNIDIETSESVSKHYNSLKREFSEINKMAIKQIGDDSVKIPPSILMRHFRSIKTDLRITGFGAVLFVPAARSFYAAIREEIFSILSIDEKIDQIIMQFGEFYEGAKRRISETPGQVEFFNKILKGKYIRSESKDWIEMERGRIEVSKASSGQQEVLPLLVALSVFPQKGRTLIIEEPEAHLFPDSQVSILECIVKQARSKETDILITTHSPYLLSALNNCILRHDREKTAQNSIDIKNVKAYSLQKGISKSLIDQDSQLISVEYIDSVSEFITNEFISLLERGENEH